MATAAADATAEEMAAPRIKGRYVAAAVVGNWLEFYDFVVYTYFAIQIGDAFFPSATPFERLMFSLITFGVGFVFRPIGAVVFGLVADRVGRRPAMLASFFMMGLALTGFVLTPSYRQIGMAAPVLAVICRLVQGFALGGEIGPNTAFLIEVAPLGKRGLYGAWQSASQSIASITAGGVGLVAAHLLSGAAMHEWGWRVALGIGVLVLPFGLIVRRTLPETLHHDEPKLDVHPDHPPGAGLFAVLAGHWRIDPDRRRHHRRRHHLDLRLHVHDHLRPDDAAHGHADGPADRHHQRHRRLRRLDGRRLALRPATAAAR